MSDAPITPGTPGGKPVGRAWWAPTMGRMTGRARIATTAVVAGLLAVSLIVWNTPAVSSLVGAEADAPSTAELALQARNAELEAQLSTSRSQTDALRDVLSDEQSARKKGETDRAAAQAQREQDAAEQEKAQNGGSSGGSGGSATSGSSRSGSSSSGRASGSAAGAAAAGAGSSTAGDRPNNPSTPAPENPAAAPATPTKPDAPSRAALIAPTSRYFGMYTEQAPFSWATFDDAAQDVGRTQNLVGYFGGWDEGFRANAVTRAWERGMLPMLTWESRPIGSANDVVDEPEYSLPNIIAGDFDAYLQKYAQDVVATGLPLAIRLDHEMNSAWYPWAEQTSSGASVNGNGVGDYVTMWQHVHDVFEAAGANQYVIWVWAPNIINNLPSRFQDPSFLENLYPGDDYVDWVGVSGYQRPPFKVDNNATFSYTYDRTLNQLRAITDKKILLAEVGASEIGGTKPAWVTSFFQGFDPGRNEDVIGFAWFNLAVTTYVDGKLTTNDWRVGSRASSLAAFRTGIADPARRFGGTVLDSAPTADPAGEGADDATPASPAPSPTSSATPSPAPSATPTPSATPSATPSPAATP